MAYNFLKAGEGNRLIVSTTRKEMQARQARRQRKCEAYFRRYVEHLRRQLNEVERRECWLKSG